MRNPASGSTSKTPCCSKIGLKRGPWTPEEDELLANYINKEGEGRWRTLPKRAGLLRCGKSCRLRWMNYLRPSVKRGQIAPDEEDLILRLHRLLGNRWSLIAGRIPGRTDNEIKNYWNTHLSKKLISQGIDPRTHKPLNPNSSSDHAKPSSSKPNRLPTPNPNPNPASSTLEEMVNGTRIIITNNKKGTGNFEGTNLNENQTGTTGLVGDVNLQNSDSSGMGLRSSTHGLSNEEDDCINYCTDDVFSSFLNSIINEDAYTTTQHQLHQHQPNGIAPVSDNLISSAQTFGFGTGWEAALLSSASAFNQSDPKRFNDHVGKQF